ncbi:MAG TPA: DUF4843 domain-containing protein, partial [Chitinophagaceae bacterium]|nr:DUF4843 domain-containing protein [Chitinophagaceae bacterium]
MRNSANKLICVLAIAALAASCEKSELTRYEEPDMIYIYRDPYGTKNDSVTYSFAIKASSLLTDTVKIPVRIMGVAKNIPREVKLAAVPASTTAVEGTHYEFLPYIIPANAYSADLPVVIKRNAALKSQEVRLQLQVAESKDFKPGVPSSVVSGSLAGATQKYLVKINDFLTKPSNWDAQLITYFGTYSQAKYKFI